MLDRGAEQSQVREEKLRRIREAGIDPFPEPKKLIPWVKYATAWFMIIMMISFVSRILNRAL